MKLDKIDTIVALASPAGMGAIHIIRMTGNDSFTILKNVIKTKSEPSFDSVRLHAYFNDLAGGKGSENKIIDRVVVHLYKAPHSYTGEDMVEINCHGSPFVAEQIITILIDHGARIADPGEFTRRAFLNGKMDLVQAEAISDLINSKTSASEYYSMDVLMGNLSNHLMGIKEKLKKNCALLELELDFADEDIAVDKKAIAEDIKKIDQTIKRLVGTFRFGRILREGFHLVIVGRPNVGKSSLMNKLLKSKRVIVAPTPGTTRDSIEEQMNIDGYLFKVTDTAGLRNGRNKIEMEGIKRTKKIMKQADLILILIDGSEPIKQDDREIIAMIRKYREKEKVVVINKSDLPLKVEIDLLRKFFPQKEYLKISSKTGKGITKLKQRLTESIKYFEKEEYIISKFRHLTALKKAEENLKIAQDSITKGRSPEFIAFDVRMALHHLGEITGEVTSEEILNDIFSSFCVGK